MSRIKVFFALFALLFATLACTMNIGGPDYPDATIPVSAQAVESMQAQFEAAFAAALLNGGDVILTVTEPQITSFLAIKLQNQNSPLFTEPQVFLRDGSMQIYGKATQGYFVANVKITVQVGVDEAGQPDIQIVSADFGPLPVPETLTASLAAIIKEAYTGAIGPVATGFRIEQIGIRDGFMVMSGKVK
ncbi:MAG: hypothetical protein HN855_00130 [Anaerolineae bacterium]|jgi:hypothetical protein|nr:hypothetical protein [Anaerolineae bacterium]MBT7073058.1 hypothetical protein [Anaerolineae bacterium]MBT7323547.1 hypothetical protein [Anaerolineae bacterium]